MDKLSKMKLNGILNIFSFALMAFTLCLKQWASVSGYSFSLRELYIEDFGGWTEMGEFKKMCTKYNIEKYPDIKEECEYISNYEIGGILYILFAVFAMSIQFYNIMSSFATSYQLEIEVFEFEFTHLLAPITHTFSIIIYLISINAAFTNFSPKFAFWLAVSNTLFMYLLSVHYKVHKNQINTFS